MSASTASMSLAMSLIIPPIAIWYQLVNQQVPEPYLDEVFHIPQARKYCSGDWRSWDPKITTPPGLYFLSLPFSLVFGCSTSVLRLTSAICTVILTLLVGVIYVQYIHAAAPGANGSDTVRKLGWHVAHNALNIALFPPLFFFSALYYTDLASTMSVISSHLILVVSHRARYSSWRRNSMLISVGIGSLLFRQTNIFWVAVFPAAITLVADLQRSHEVVRSSMYTKAEGFGDSLMSVVKTSWRLNAVYDIPITSAVMDDYLRCLISIATCLIKTTTQPKILFRLLTRLSPFLSLIGLFAAFIIVNGSVVLGDKSNHVATLHLPQMLYIWPYIVFFSWPLLYHHLMTVPIGILTRIATLTPVEVKLMFKRHVVLPHWRFIVVFAVTAAIAIRYNTIVHPFTLADNRHYTFYVFRILTRRWWMRFAVIPVYILCAWACTRVLGSAPSPRRQTPSDKFSTDESIDAFPLPDTRHAVSTSFVMIWTATCALQLITAPLVEPRYLIVPWIFWRLHVPIKHTDALLSAPRGKAREPESVLERLKRVVWDQHDHRLWLETAFFLLINAVTGYMFLYRGFDWPSEPGKVQRFMW